jgi:hypothetical protein
VNDAEDGAGPRGSRARDLDALASALLRRYRLEREVLLDTAADYSDERTEVLERIARGEDADGE